MTFVDGKHMRRAGLWAWSLLVPAAMVGSNATACSVRASYRIPTTLQVVDQADAVVLARVVDGGPTADAYLAGLGARRARFDPFAAIKGNVAVDRIMFDEALLEVPGSDLT